MQRIAWTLSAPVLLALSLSCQKPPDPLAEQRATTYRGERPALARRV